MFKMFQFIKYDKNKIDKNHLEDENNFVLKIYIFERKKRDLNLLQNEEGFAKIENSGSIMWSRKKSGRVFKLL
jgi:hypothetical protein